MKSLIVMTLLFVSSIASAQTADERIEARSYFERGSLAYEQEQWHECAELFERSFSLVFAPAILFNIGVCYENEQANIYTSEERLTVAERAVAAFQRYQRETGDTSPETADRVSAIQEQVVHLREEVEQEQEVVIFVAPVEEARAQEERDTVLRETTLPTPTLESNTFDYGLVALFAVPTVLTFVSALGSGTAAMDEYNTLRDTCGSTEEGCTEEDIANVETLSLVSNVLFAVSSGLLVGTGITIGLELATDNSTVQPEAFNITYEGTF